MATSDRPSYILHIGHTKCGSSALQTAFSKQPVSLSVDGAKYEYVAIVNAERLLRDDKLRARASFSPWGYVPSLRSSALGQLPCATINAAVTELSEICRSGTVPILSCETWFTEARTINLPLLTGPVKDAHAVLYVRPHVEWINSAWWQWGAWTGQPFDEWFDAALDEMLYEESISAWAKHPSIRNLVVRQLPVDIVEDFASLFGITGLSTTSVNRGPGAEILRLFQRHRELRPDPHASAIDFIVERRLGDIESAKPWVLDQMRVERILGAARQDISMLRKIMTPDQVAILDSDPRWSDPSIYASFDVSPADPQPPAAGEMDALAAAALRAIQRLDDENRAVRRERELMAVEREELRSELQNAHASKKTLVAELQHLQNATCAATADELGTSNLRK